MESSVRPQPTYYDVLGLSPRANQDEIRRAFAKVMGMFGAHPLAAAAELSAAFETLRDPAKRRAYDDAHGLTPEPAPRLWTMAVPAQSSRGFIASAVAPTEKPSSDALARLARLAEPQPLAPEPKATARPMPTRTPLEQSDAKLELHIERMLAAKDDEGEDKSLDWKRPALAVGGLLVAAGLIGALAGSSAMDPSGARQAKASVGRPKATGRAPALAASAPIVAPQAGEVQAAVPAQAPAAPFKQARTLRHPLRGMTISQAPASAESAAGADLADNAPPAAPDSTTTHATAAAPATVATIAASGLPLAGKLMARTIERIGYACGDVASTTPVEGEAAGVYKVTCTSGDTYRAAPQRGRYRFRRWSKP